MKSTSTRIMSSTNIIEDGVVVERSATETTGSLPTEVDVSIKDFFGKPFLVTSDSWLTNEAAGSLLFSFDVDSQLVSNPLWSSKWSGFSMVRAKAVVRLQLNATPFHAGRVIMNFVPLKPAFDTIQPAYSAMHTFNLTTRTMLPGIEMDASDTAGVLEIPYITPADYFALTPTGSSSSMPSYNRGTVQISVLSPLATGPIGETTIYFSVYLHFEDVELVGPVVPQGKKGKFRSKVYNAAEKELVASSKGTISSGLRSVASIAHSLSAVPFLTPVAEPASWVADGLAGLASFFGYSKPLANVAPGIAARQLYRYAATSDGVDPSLPLALRSDNCITLSDEFSIYHGDEMSWSFLKQIPALVKVVDWTGIAVQGASLYNEGIRPGNILNSQVITRGSKSVTVQTGPPMWYIGRLFRYWRGGIKVTVKIVKTQFHSGRLQVTWTPRPNPIIPTITTGQYALREIIDIREGNEFTYVLPYLQPTQFTDQVGGYLDIKIINTLRNPETVANNVQLLMYFSGAEDLEIAVPSFERLAPPFSPQMFSPSADKAEILAEKPIGSSTAPAFDARFGSSSIGELFTSVRQLVLRNTQLFASNPGTPTELNIWPYFTSCTYLDTTGIVGPNYGGDMFSYVSPMYAFYRGGMRVTVVSATSGPMTATLAPLLVTANADVISSTSRVINGSSAVLNWKGNNTNVVPSGSAPTDGDTSVISVSTPYYCRTPVSLNVPSPTGQIPTNFGAPEISESLGAVNVKGISVPVLYRSIAEDFQFTYFVGCPPIIASLPTALREGVDAPIPGGEVEISGAWIDSLVDFRM